MKTHDNTLYVMTQGAYLAKEGQQILVRVEKETRLRVPIHTLDGIVCFGAVSASPFALQLCGENAVAVSFLTEHGRFLGRLEGATSGNVLLRRRQYKASDDLALAATIAASCVAAKIANCRTSLLRATRDHPESAGAGGISKAADDLADCLRQLRAEDGLDAVRGVEGRAAAAYFDVFDHLIVAQKDSFRFESRNRRPPLDPVNALLSFLYALVTHDARSACEVVGLDPQVGFLHRDRPGRPSLALDLVEEMRPVLADRLALSLINRCQVSPGGFRKQATGAIEMDDKTRKAVLVAYQKRKAEAMTHPFLNEKTTLGMVLLLQARLLARYLRGDLDAYPAFFWK